MFFENLHVYEIMWNNIIQLDMPWVLFYNTAHELCVLDTEVYKHTITIYNTYSFPQQQRIFVESKFFSYMCTGCLFVK